MARTTTAYKVEEVDLRIDNYVSGDEMVEVFNPSDPFEPLSSGTDGITQYIVAVSEQKLT
jgi:hypothetical protein